jgi:hypothetical protein
MIPRVCQAAFLSLWIASGSAFAQGHTEQSCRSACERLDEKMASFVPPNRCACECKEGWARPSANAACKKTCPQDFVTFRNRCQHKVAVEDELIQRKLAILKGMKGAIDAINAERRTKYLLVIEDLDPVLAAMAMSLAAKDVNSILAESVAISVALTKAESDIRGCSASENLRANCENLKNFHRMLRENYDELAGVRR